MVDENSEDYKAGFRKGVKFTCDQLIDVSHKFRRDILDIMGLM